MGGGPPTVTRVLDVPLRRPRDIDAVDDAAVVATKRQIRAALAH
jgi:hypothetical protein